MATVGEVILERRNKLNLTREQVASRTGGQVTESAIGKIERGEVKDPNRSTLAALGRVLGIEESALYQLKAGSIRELPKTAITTPISGHASPATMSPAIAAHVLSEFASETPWTVQRGVLDHMQRNRIETLYRVLSRYLYPPAPEQHERAAG